MKKNLYLLITAFILSAAILFAGHGKAFAQDDNKAKKVSGDTKKYRAESIALLKEMKENLEKYYYDKNFRGIDLEAKVKAAKDRINTLEYNWQMYRVLVQFLMDFDDSHTRFQLPSRADFFDYGFSMQMFGAECFIISVKKGSDAEKQGLVVGDKIVNIGKFKPHREDLWKILYVLYKLDPADTVDLAVEKLDGAQQKLTVKAKTMTQKERREELKSKKNKEKFEPFKCQEVNTQTIACKLYTFVVERNDIDKMMKQARNYPKMILDLRGNGGGLVSIEEYLLGHFFEQDVKIGDVISRDKTETRYAKTRGDKVYKGDLVVLIDSRSASAAEMTSRVLQLEKRAKIVGDVSSGAVMTSYGIGLFSPASSLSVYVLSSVGMSVSVADVVMKDGSRLEKVGVIPDVPVIPTGAALNKKMDAVLAYAASMLGAKLTPEKAGEFYFITQKENDEDLDKNADEGDGDK
ncbi:MAG: S41 family peptidase [Pyrinomonadaceae bacterium]